MYPGFRWETQLRNSQSSTVSSKILTGSKSTSLQGFTLEERSLVFNRRPAGSLVSSISGSLLQFSVSLNNRLLFIIFHPLHWAVVCLWKQIYLIFIAGHTKSIIVNKNDHKREEAGAVHTHQGSTPDLKWRGWSKVPWEQGLAFSAYEVFRLACLSPLQGV